MCFRGSSHTFSSTLLGTMSIRWEGSRCRSSNAPIPGTWTLLVARHRNSTQLAQPIYEQYIAACDQNATLNCTQKRVMASHYPYVVQQCKAAVGMRWILSWPSSCIYSRGIVLTCFSKWIPFLGGSLTFCCAEAKLYWRLSTIMTY